MTDQSQGDLLPVNPSPRKRVGRSGRHAGRPLPPFEALAAAGAMLRAHRESRGLTILYVATRAKISGVHLSDIERGMTGVSVEIVEDVATVLGLDVAEVLCAFRVVPQRAAAKFFDAERMRKALEVGT